jgi:hypothetical protein
MQVEAVLVDALVGEETLSKLFSGQLITFESGLEPSVLFFLFLELIKRRCQSAPRTNCSVHLCESQQSWEDMSCALQIGLLRFCLLNIIREVIHILTE